MVQCLSCGGRYEPIGADGVPYAHVCPPLSAFELDAAVTAGKVVLPKGETVDDAVLRRVYRRKNARDERAAPRAQATDPPAIVSAGKGVTPVSRADVPADAAPVLVDV